MSLRIPNHNQSVEPSSTIKKDHAQPVSSVSPLAQNAVQDKASISNASSQVSGGFAVRQDKVDSLRAQVTSGNYSVNPKAVANSMSSDPFWCPTLPISGR